MQNGEKEEVDQRAKKLKETVFLVGDSMITKINGYVLTKSITTAKTIDMYGHLKPTLQDFNPGLLIIYVGTTNLPLNKTSNEIAKKSCKSCRICEKNPAQTFQAL